MADKLNILVWNEGVHEANNQPETMAEMYPKGMHGAIADGLKPAPVVDLPALGLPL